MKIGDELPEGVVSRKVYDQSLKKTVFFAMKDGIEVRLTGNEKVVEVDERKIIVKKLEEVTKAIKDIPKVEIPEPKEFPAFPTIPEYPKFPAFPEKMTVNVPDLSNIEKKLDTIIGKEDNETKGLIKNALEELKKTKSDKEVVQAITKLSAIVPKSQDYTDILKEISGKLLPALDTMKIDEGQFKKLLKALSSIGGFGGGPGAVQLRSENGTILNPATEEGQTSIVTAIENITIPAPAGGATEAKQDAIITALGNVKIDTGDIDLNTDGLETIGTATNTKLDTQIVNQETLISLIGTLQELSQRLAPLASAMNSGAPGLRVTPNAATLPVSGTVTATVASTSITNFGTGNPAKEVADDINSQMVTLCNINNVTAS